MTIFSFRDYKAFLRHRIQESSAQSGYKGKLAAAAGCQRAYLSQVLNSHVHLTPDHAAGLVLYWGLDETERDFFLELVNLARAATPGLKKLLETRLDALASRQTTVSGRITRPKLESLQQQSEYYSAWYFSAIHVLITISKFRTPSAIAKRLNLSHEIVIFALRLLEQMGLAKKQKGETWLPVSFDLHLPKTSPLNSINHFNWRMLAVQDARKDTGDGVHFTAVYSMSQRDFEEIRNRVLELVSSSRELAIGSAEEELVSFTCDFFRV